MVIKKINILFLGIFIFSFFCFYIFLFLRGFGWDGDSMGTASQFVKLFNHNIFEAGYGGGVPKIMSIFTFGVIYQIFGSLYFLTFLSIFLNSLMLTLICKWVYKNGGFWFITMVGLLANVLWLAMVTTCDNTAFSLPFTFFGLYCYFHKNNKIGGSFALLIASLYRPGPEIVLFFILLIELFKHNKDIRLIIIVFFLFIIGIMHTCWGYRLSYVSYGSFVDSCIKPDNDLTYMHSAKAILPYLQGIMFQITRPSAFIFFLLSIPGFIRIVNKPNDIKFSGLSIFASYLVPISTFRYGNYGSIPWYHMEFTFFFAIFAAFFCYKNTFLENIIKRFQYKLILKFIIILVLLVFICHKGLKMRGSYEINPDGSGVMGWRSLSGVKKIIQGRSNLRAIVMSDDALFCILDLGLKLRELNVLNNIKDIQKIQCSDYDIVILDRSSEKYCSNLGKLFKKEYIDDKRVVFIRK
jgi:hypothetical protein